MSTQLGTIDLSMLFAGAIFLGVLACLQAGWVHGRKRMARHEGKSDEGLGAIDASIFGLMGLLAAFTFTGAAGRFHDRTQLITDQVNAIGTAYLRLDLLDDHAADQMKAMFRDYVDSLLDLYKTAQTQEELERRRAGILLMESSIWEHAVMQVKADRSQPLAQVLLPSLNEMFDIGSARVLAMRLHPPGVIFGMLGVIICVCALFAGFSMAKSPHRSFLHMVGFALITALAVYIILDLEYPRRGFVRVDKYDRALVELRASMN